MSNNYKELTFRPLGEGQEPRQPRPAAQLQHALVTELEVSVVQIPRQVLAALPDLQASLTNVCDDGSMIVPLTSYWPGTRSVLWRRAGSRSPE